MRIGLIGNRHGHVPALEASIAGCRAAGVDVLVHCGDFLSARFSPDPPLHVALGVLTLTTLSVE